MVEISPFSLATRGSMGLMKVLVPVSIDVSMQSDGYFVHTVTVQYLLRARGLHLFRETP